MQLKLKIESFGENPGAATREVLPWILWIRGIRVGNRSTIELRCSRDLALRLGAVGPQTAEHHRILLDRADPLGRDLATGWPVFWEWQIWWPSRERSSSY